MKLLVLVGSNRVDSYNARLADLAVAELPQDVEVSRFDINALPFYSEHFDADGEIPAPVAAFRAEVAEADVILLASPSYNGTMTAQVKNAIDTASRPREHAAIHGKPVAVVTAAYHRGAGESVLRAIHAAATVAGATPIEGGTIVAPHVEAFDADGSLKDETVAIELAEFVRALAVPAAV